MNPAEEIVKFWLQEKGYFIQSSIKNKRKEIDILAIHALNTDDRIHVEVSVSINMVDTEHSPETKASHYMECNFDHPTIQQKVQERFGHDVPYTRNLVIGDMRLQNKDNTDAFINECLTLGITVIRFSDVLKEVSTKLSGSTQLNAIIKTVQLCKKFI